IPPIASAPPRSRSRSRRCNARRSDGKNPPSIGRRGTCQPKIDCCHILAGGCRMIRLFVATIYLAWLVFPAMAAGLDTAAINSAEFRSKLPAEDKADAAVVKAQVLLDRAHFSPGEIDGKLGENAQKALKAFADAKGLPSDKALTPEIWTMLAGTSQDPVIADYKISDSDVKGPFLEKLPAKLDDMNDLKA